MYILLKNNWELFWISNVIQKKYKYIPYEIEIYNKLIIKWYFFNFDSWKVDIQEWNLSLKKEQEKQELIEQYKNLQKEIIEVRAELEDIEDNIEKWNITEEQKLQVANARISILEARRKEKRDLQDLLVSEWIEKYWMEILDNF